MSISAFDPQRTPLDGTLEVFETSSVEVVLRDLLLSRDCDEGFFPEGSALGGIGFVIDFFGTGTASIIDFAFAVGVLGLNCPTPPRYVIRAGKCTPDNLVGFQRFLDLSGLALPLPVCILRAGAIESLTDLTVLDFDTDSIRFTTAPEGKALEAPFQVRTTTSIDISSLLTGAEHRLVVTVTDRDTVPITAEAPFLFQGESTMVITSGGFPEAAIRTDTLVDCDPRAGGSVFLDASASTDPDGDPRDRLQFEWFANFGLPTEEFLGGGRGLRVTLPVGVHSIALRVTDDDGLTDVAETIVTVVDSTPPILL